MATLNALAIPLPPPPPPPPFCRSNCLLIQALGSRLYALQGVNQSSVYLRLLSACHGAGFGFAFATDSDSDCAHTQRETHTHSHIERDKLQLLIAHAASYVPMPKLRIRHAALTTTAHTHLHAHTHTHSYWQTHAVPIRCVPHTAYTYQHQHQQAHCVYVHLISAVCFRLSASDATACGICQLIFCCTLLEIHTLCMPLLLHPSRKASRSYPLSLSLALQSSTLFSSVAVAVFFVLACILHIAERNFNLRRQQPSHAPRFPPTFSLTLSLSLFHTAGNV